MLEDKPTRPPYDVMDDDVVEAHDLLFCFIVMAYVAKGQSREDDPMPPDT